MATSMLRHGPTKPLCLHIRPHTVSPVTLTLLLVLPEDTEDTEVPEDTVPLQLAPCVPARPNPERVLTATTVNGAVTNSKPLPGPCPASRGC